nr:EOG090X0MNC [Lepidurus arcticus]
MGLTAKEKREQQKKQDAKIAGYQQLVTKAFNQVDPLSEFSAFKTFNKNDFKASVHCNRVTHMEANLVDWAVDLLQRNMLTMYEQSKWGWDLRKKRKEMTEEEAWYLVMSTSVDSKPIAYSHFRFDMDYERPVLYCYEVQVESEFLRRGLGKFIMQLLALIAFKNRLHKVVLTVFRHNSAACTFFRSLGYSTDDTSPEEDEEDYEILSRVNPHLVEEAGPL